MQENGQNQSPHKYKEAAGFYEPIVKRNYEQILNVEAVVLGFQFNKKTSKSFFLSDFTNYEIFYSESLRFLYYDVPKRGGGRSYA